MIVWPAITHSWRECQRETHTKTHNLCTTKAYYVCPPCIQITDYNDPCMSYSSRRTYGLSTIQVKKRAKTWDPRSPFLQVFVVVLARKQILTTLPCSMGSYDVCYVAFTYEFSFLIPTSSWRRNGIWKLLMTTMISVYSCAFLFYFS